jgi:ATP-dependent Lon protease
MSRPADSHGDWVLWRIKGHGHVSLYIQPDLASELDSEFVERAQARLAAEEAELAKSQRDKEATRERAEEEARSGSAAIGAHRAHASEVLRHAVFPNIDAVSERLRRLEDGLYGDRDHTTRDCKALGAALERGPARSVVRPAQWRQALDNLAAEMPAFRSAVAILTHALALSEATQAVPSVPPMLLVGPPGVGKSHFCRRLAEVMQCGSAWLAMDQPTAGCDLRGSDNHWSTSRHGVLFDLLGLGDTANPLVVLDEIDKAPRRQGTQEIDMLSQLYSVLEPETSRRVEDVSLDVALDASLVMYVATANELRTLDAPLLSRFEVVQVGLPTPEERRESAARVVDIALARLGVQGAVRVSPGCVALLEQYTPRVIGRAVERAVGAAVAGGRNRVGIEDMEAALGLSPWQQPVRMH